MKNLFVLALASAFFFSACAKKNSTPSRLGTGTGQQTDAGYKVDVGVGQKTDEEAAESKPEIDKNGFSGSTNPPLANGESTATEGADPSAGAKASTSQSTTVPTESKPETVKDEKVTDSELPEIEDSNESAEDITGDTEVESKVQTNNSSLGYKQNLLKLAKGNNRVEQALRLSSKDNEYIGTVTYCYNGVKSQIPAEKEKYSTIQIMPSSRVLVEERGAQSGTTNYVLNSCEALPKASDKNYYEQIYAYTEMDPADTKLNATQLGKLKQFDFIEMEAGSANREEYVSSDGSTKEGIKTSIVCVENLKAKQLMKPEVDSDKKVKNRITLAAGSTMYFQRPLEAKDEKGRVLNTLSEMKNKPYVVIFCRK